MITHQYIQPAFKVAYFAWRQVCERLQENLLHGIVGSIFIFQVFHCYTDEQNGIALQQMPKPGIIAGAAIGVQQFVVAQGAMFLRLGHEYQLGGVKMKKRADSIGMLEASRWMTLERVE